MRNRPTAGAYPSFFYDFKYVAPTSYSSLGSPFYPPTKMPEHSCPLPFLWNHQCSGCETGTVGGRRCEQGSCVTRFLVFPPKSCPEAIKEVFHNKFHIIGAVGIGIAVVMVSVLDIGVGDRRGSS